jgi:hypothetical protein
MEHQSGMISTDDDLANVSHRAPKCAIVRGVVTESSEAYELSNVVETALARALVLAAKARRWDVVAKIAEDVHELVTQPLAAIVVPGSCVVELGFRFSE